jgi:hypothetical protein
MSQDAETRTRQGVCVWSHRSTKIASNPLFMPVRSIFMTGSQYDRQDARELGLILSKSIPDGVRGVSPGGGLAKGIQASDQQHVASTGIVVFRDMFYSGE